MCNYERFDATAFTAGVLSLSCHLRQCVLIPWEGLLCPDELPDAWRWTRLLDVGRIFTIWSKRCLFSQFPFHSMPLPSSNGDYILTMPYIPINDSPYAFPMCKTDSSQFSIP